MRKEGFLEKFFSVILILVLIVFSPTSVFAIDSSRLNMFSHNNILFYDPHSSNYDCGSVRVGSFDGNTTAGLSELQASFVDAYHDIAQNLSVEYGIPWETVVAQGILESAAGTSNFARTRNNFFGIGAFDSNPDNAFSYDTPEEGWRGYYENIRKTATYRNHGVFAGETITNPYAYAQAIKDAGYASDPTYVEKLSKLIGAIENRAKEKGWQSSAELAKTYPEMTKNAGNNAGGGDEPASTVATSGCLTVGSGNGDINATAIVLSWPDRSHRPTDPKPEYATALAESGVNKLGDTCSMGGYSCDAFLATVMRYSGADPSFPCCGAAMQRNYLLSHPELYEVIPNTGNTSNLQPGDIRANGGHVEIVVQLEDGSFKIASASHCDRTADHYANYYADSSYQIFRRKQ